MDQESKGEGTRRATQARRGRFRGSVFTCADAGGGRTTPVVVIAEGGACAGVPAAAAPALGLLFLYQGILSALILSPSHPNACTYALKLVTRCRNASSPFRCRSLSRTDASRCGVQRCRSRGRGGQHGQERSCPSS